jgi:hypothetical protein
MQFFSSSQIVDSRCSVTLDFNYCFVQDRRTGALLAMMASGSLSGFAFPPLQPPPVSRPLLSPLLVLFSSGIIVLDIYVVFASRL